MIICISYHDEKSDAFIILVTTPVITGNKQRKTLIISHGKKLAYKSQDIPHYMTVERRKLHNTKSDYYNGETVEQ